MSDDMDQVLLSDWCDICSTKFTDPLENGGIFHIACKICNAPRNAYKTENGNIKRLGYLKSQTPPGVVLDSENAGTSNHLLVRCQDCQNNLTDIEVVAFRARIAEEGFLDPKE